MNFPTKFKTFYSLHSILSLVYTTSYIHTFRENYINSNKIFSIKRQKHIQPNREHKLYDSTPASCSSTMLEMQRNREKKIEMSNGKQTKRRANTQKKSVHINLQINIFFIELCCQLQLQSQHQIALVNG